MGIEGKQEDNRLYLFDNVKAVLITLVVFGHALELIFWQRNSIAYSFIYLFHMPLFVFCSGYFAKYNPKKIWTRLIGTYVVFQFLYVLFDRLALGNEGSFIHFTTPYWILWYLMALILWTLHLPLLEVITNTRKKMILTICASLILGVVAGFDDTLGYYLSLGRFMHFYPFFVVGYCVKKTMNAHTFRKFISKWYMISATGLFTAFVLAWLIFNNEAVHTPWLWRAVSYERLEDSGYSYLIRIMLYLSAFVISLFVLAIMPRRKTFFSYIGQRTMPVFLFHGFVILLLRQHEVTRLFPEGILVDLFLVGISIAMTLLFSSRLFHWKKRVKS